MANFEVDHSHLREVAAAVNTYCTTQDSQMRSADTEIKSMLTADWLGLDAQEFGKKWEAVDDSNSTAVKFREYLKNFADNLVSCANIYEGAQSQNYNDAKWLQLHFW